MKFTVVKIFNPEALGLANPHYAVVARMPKDLGGGERIVDVMPLPYEGSPEAIRLGFKSAAASMPYRANKDGGGEIDFFGTDYRGKPFKQNTAHIPAKPLAGKCFPEALVDWLCWRARVHLWAEQHDRVALSPENEQRLLRTLNGQEEDIVAEHGRPVAVYAAPKEAVSGDTAPRKVPLTLGCAPV